MVPRAVGGRRAADHRGTGTTCRPTTPVERQPAARRARSSGLRGRKAGSPGLLHARRWRRQLRPRAARPGFPHARWTRRHRRSAGRQASASGVGQGRAESRKLPERGYDDPTAHCFVAGVPRSMYARLRCRSSSRRAMSCSCTSGCPGGRFRSTGVRTFPDNIRLWQGDSVGRWEGDTLVVETKNLNGKTWLNEVGDIVSHAQRSSSGSSRSTQT